MTFGLRTLISTFYFCLGVLLNKHLSPMLISYSFIFLCYCLVATFCRHWRQPDYYSRQLSWVQHTRRGLLFGWIGVGVLSLWTWMRLPEPMWKHYLMAVMFMHVCFFLFMFAGPALGKSLMEARMKRTYLFFQEEENVPIGQKVEGYSNLLLAFIDFNTCPYKSREGDTRLRLSKKVTSRFLVVVDALCQLLKRPEVRTGNDLELPSSTLDVLLLLLVRLPLVCVGDKGSETSSEFLALEESILAVLSGRGYEEAIPYLKDYLLLLDTRGPGEGVEALKKRTEACLASLLTSADADKRYLLRGSRSDSRELVQASANPLASHGVEEAEELLK
ncbi:hypothetical protein CP488_00982 [Chthonomonas calidirosea]|nr:hypothetical protein CP488_00982 [Chthonomonas calidirosea]